MKKTLQILATVLLIFVWNTAFSQAPQKFSYQTVIRNSSNQLLANQQVGIKISILQGSETGIVVYSERHSPSTNANGLATLSIGTGSVLSGNFQNINWSSGSYYIQTETDPNGGNSYTITSTQQLLSVPYALYSSVANSANTATTANNGVPAGGTNGQFLTNCNGVATWTTAGYCPGTISNLNCALANNIGSLFVNQASSSVSTSIPFTGGGGGTHSGQMVSSTGVTGLTATLSAGTFANGSGTLNYTISGTPVTSGTASFALNIGGQTCVLTRLVFGKINSLNCASATSTGLLIRNVMAYNVSGSIPYLGGDGGEYTGQSISSTGVNGLTASITDGSFNNGAGNLTYTISGTPESEGTAIFTLNIGSQTCTLNLIVSLGSVLPATCGATNVHNPAKTYGSMTDLDGNVYKTIVIGNQEWMAENLKTSKYSNGDELEVVNNFNDWVSTGSGSWCFFNNDIQYECPYGKLYNGSAVIDSRNVCPISWHFPTNQDWLSLINFLGGVDSAGSKLSNSGYQYWGNQNNWATNESGFSGLPGGFLWSEYQMTGIGIIGYYWSNSNSWRFANGFIDEYLIFDPTLYSSVYLSVRCIKD